VVDGICAPLATRRTLDGLLGSLARRHVVTFANADQQRAAHALGRPDRSVGGLCERMRQARLRPPSALQTLGLDVAEKTKLGPPEPSGGPKPRLRWTRQAHQ
jgi:hypothetical protein